jgi:hypothetical protein
VKIRVVLMTFSNIKKVKMKQFSGKIFLFNEKVISLFYISFIPLKIENN